MHDKNCYKFLWVVSWSLLKMNIAVSLLFKFGFIIRTWRMFYLFLLTTCYCFVYIECGVQMTISGSFGDLRYSLIALKINFEWIFNCIIFLIWIGFIYLFFKIRVTDQMKLIPLRAESSYKREDPSE